MNGRTAFPPCGVVVIFCDLVETELLVVIGADKFGSIDRALFQRGIDVAAGDLLRCHANLLHDLAGEAGDTHLQAFEVVDGVDFLTEPAAHLGAGIAEQDRVDIVLGKEFIEQLVATGLVEPGIRLACVKAEGNRRSERKGRILADVIIGAGMRHFDGSGRHRIRCLQRRHDFTAGEMLNDEVAAGGFLDMICDDLARAEKNVEALGEGRRHAPGDLGVFLCNGRSGQRRCGNTGANGARLADK
ncbi:hypothetical protein D3C86_1320600 [compost metagenome]